MKIELVENIKNFDIEVIFIKDFKALNKKTIKILKEFNFEAKEGKHLLLTDAKKLYIGLSKLKNEDLKIAASNAINELKEYKFKKIKIALAEDKKELDLKTLVEGLLLGSYEFQKYKSKVKNSSFDILIDTKNSKKNIEELKKDLEDIKTICSSVNMVRTIVNTTPEDYTPITMAKDAKKIAAKNNLECKIYGEEFLLNNGMNAMLAVGRASRHESQLIHLTYKPKNPKGKIVLVGKGLTYDSGGLSLKSSTGMVTMKCDKSGGAAVLGIMDSLKNLAYEYEVHGIIGAVENMIGGEAYKPDDVLVAKNKVTIEVRNTDAEGRLVLADCLCYAQDEIKDIDYIFDMATLTGACVIALGEFSTGIMGHSKSLKKKFEKASKASGELVGFLPYNRYLPELIKSSVADIVNSTSSKGGGAITASLFLDNFIKKENKKKWLHFDIAGAAYKERNWGYNPYGGSGAGVRMILKFIENLNSK
ncbi:MAG: leucyl aminopeptidase [Halarcobacter sp.]